MRVVGQRRGHPEIAHRFGEHDRERRPARRCQQRQHDSARRRPATAVHPRRRLELLPQATQRPRERQVGEGHTLHAQHHDHPDRPVEQVPQARGRHPHHVENPGGFQQPLPPQSDQVGRRQQQREHRGCPPPTAHHVGAQHAPRHPRAEGCGQRCRRNPDDQRVQRPAQQGAGEGVPKSLQREPRTALPEQVRAEGHQQEQHDRQHEDRDDHQPEQQPRAAAQTREVQPRSAQPTTARRGEGSGRGRGRGQDGGHGYLIVLSKKVFTRLSNGPQK